MSFLSAVRVALSALLVNKGRSALTSLGIVIGISAVIAMVSAGEGARFLLEDRLASLGKNLIMIRPGSPMSQVTLAGTPLTNEDAHTIRKHFSHELTAVAELLMVQRMASRHALSHPTAVTGCTPDLPPVRGWHVQSGRFISAADNKKMANVCVAGATLKDKLFSKHADILGPDAAARLSDPVRHRRDGPQGPFTPGLRPGRSALAAVEDIAAVSWVAASGSA